MFNEKNIPYLLGVVLGLSALFLQPYIYPSEEFLSFFISFLIIFLFSAVFYILHIVIHEIGHLIFGLIAGYQFVSIRFFSLMLKKEENKLKFSKFSVPGTGGQCLMEPNNLKDTLNSAILYNAGGALMNIIASIVALVIALSLKEKSLIFALLFLFSVIGILTSAMNIIPLKLSGIVNDGYNIKLLKEDNNSLLAFNSVLMMNAKINQGLYYDDIKDEYLFYNENYNYSNPLLTAHAAFYINSLCEDKNFKEAHKIINSLLENNNEMIDYYKSFLKAENLFFDLCFGTNEEMYKERFEDLEEYFAIHKNTTYANRQAIAYYQVVGDQINYEKHLDKFKNLKQQLSNKADILNESNLFDLIPIRNEDL